MLQICNVPECIANDDYIVNIGKISFHRPKGSLSQNIKFSPLLKVNLVLRGLKLCIFFKIKVHTNQTNSLLGNQPILKFNEFRALLNINVRANSTSKTIYINIQ